MSTVKSVFKVFVSNIPWTISQRELKQYFSEYGQVAYTSVVFDRTTGLSKGYGFVSFTTQGGVDAVTSKTTHSLEGNNLVIQPTD
ncbi:uncharacterized protein LOC135845721 [Planococcus citri]|uniref:uncharacterized protein LOC135845721 n=1 Tax=Planococcus citri TaxID=170843 RepID=UPI0031F7EC55